MSHASGPPRIYLDNAATSWPKPEEVYRAVDHYQRHLGAAAGRSGYAEAVEVSRAVDRARSQIAAFLGLADPTHLIFTLNGTDALNLAIHGLLKQGDHVVTTVAEHNSVLRPLAELQATGVIEVTRVGGSAAGVVDLDDIRRAIRSDTRLVALTQASNVTGAIQPVAEVAKIAHELETLVLCDAAQSAGHVPLDMRDLDVDLLAMPGHKGLLGPLGTGLLAIHPRIANQLHSVRQGGTGTNSEQVRQPNDLPHKFEAGNLNVPGILGLAAGVGYLANRGIAAIQREGRDLTARLLEGFGQIEGLRVLGPSDASSRVPLVSIAIEGYDPQEVALSLDSVFRIQVRPGLHCAPAMHEALGTSRTGGTVRFSLGAMTTADEIDTAVRAMTEITSTEMFS